MFLIRLSTLYFGGGGYDSSLLLRVYFIYLFFCLFLTLIFVHECFHYFER